MGLPERYRITEGEMWQMYINDELYDFVTLDHVLLAKKLSDNTPVWVRVMN